jgi:hypothetical protein
MHTPDMFLPAVLARERLARGTVLAMVAQGVMGIDVPGEVSSLYWRVTR